MGSVTIARSLAVGALLAAAGVALVARDRGPNGEPTSPARSSGEEPAALIRQPATAPPSAATDTAAARLLELNEMSETFRNSTFLIAIRDAGFVCSELLGVYGGVNDSATWTATCSGMLAYTVRVAQNGGLGIEPLLGHIDSLPFAPLPAPGGEVLLPPISPAPR